MNDSTKWLLKTDGEWWEQLGLRIAGDGMGRSGDDARETRAHADVLAAFAPPHFEGTIDDQVVRVSTSELAASLGRARDEVGEAIEAESVARSHLGWSRIAAAFEADDAEEVIADGVWAGFTRAHATAWLWNLTQYEPYQFAGVFAQLRRERERALAAGEIPATPRYAERARQLEAHGMTPQSYRAAQQALGKGTFSEGAVSTGRCTCGEG